MTEHKEFSEDLALYALNKADGLEPGERAALEEHLKECVACRRELEQLRGDTGLLALSAPQQTPPAHARRRLMSAIAAESRAARAPGRHALWMLVPSLAAVALAIVAIILWRQDAGLRAALATLEANYSRQQDQLQSASQLLAILTDPAATRFTLSAAKTTQPQGKAIYARDRASLIFLASNMPALPPQRAYELWLIPATGAPIPAGIFKPAADGSAAVINPPLPRNVQAKTFAITVEPESGSPAPTSQPIMVGAGG